ncbi:terpenoid synthase [Obba rivulosa]|uniref:Terpenoid synthase n=1 Tax=Obba rivulosa TaxID=1052685 RepID=A0A8E2AWP6_9APHY|nr:terpenoid synthase [Obba rivulosa]
MSRDKSGCWPPLDVLPHLTHHKDKHDATSVLTLLNEESTTEAARAAIAGFLRRLDITILSHPRDLELERRVDEIMQTWKGLPCPRHCVVPSIAIAISGYAHIHDFDTKVFIAVLTSIAVTLDSPEFLATLPFEDFHYDVVTGRIQERSGYLGEFVRCLQDAWKYFPRFSAATIFTSGLDFVNAALLESTGTTVATGALPFVEYRRIKTGVAEAYAHFIWDGAQFPNEVEYAQVIPDAMLYVNYANDIMSFYKEEMAGETATYIQDRALATGKSRFAALYDLIEDTIAVVRRVRGILGEGRARDAWEAFVAGYIEFHTNNPRYRLAEIIDAEYVIS